jgi:cytochrome c553
VNKRYKGDFGPYIAMWEQQLARLKQLHARGQTAVVRGRDTSKGKSRKYSARLRDQQLAEYIGNVGKRLKILKCLAGAQTIKSAGAEPSSPARKRQPPLDKKMVAAGRKSAESAGCLRCHGKDAVRRYNHIPDLAGQNIFYAVRQLKMFQAHRPAGAPAGPAARHSPFMRIQTSDVNDNDMWNLAVYFAVQSFCSQEERRYTGADEPKPAAACVTCHGAEGTSVYPEVPNIAGQNKEYLLRQLRAFRASDGTVARDGGLADSRYHYFMTRTLKALTDFDLAEIAEYYSGLQCPGK